jgi:hypothetical protein
MHFERVLNHVMMGMLSQAMDALHRASLKQDSLAVEGQALRKINAANALVVTTVLEELQQQCVLLVSFHSLEQLPHHHARVLCVVRATTA